MSQGLAQAVMEVRLRVVMLRIEGLKQSIAAARLSDADRFEIEFNFDRVLRAITKVFDE